MNILTIDTATELLDVSITTKTGSFHEHAIHSGFTHTQRLMPVIEALLAESSIPAAELDLVVCARGPGSFTGLRIGMATAKGLRASTGARLVSIPTLDALAYRYAWFNGIVVPVIDARKHRIYAAQYRTGVRLGDYLDIAPKELLPALPEGSPSLFTAVNPTLLSAVADDVPDASSDLTCSTGRAYAALGMKRLSERGADDADSGPMYIRMSDAEEKMSAAR